MWNWSATKDLNCGRGNHVRWEEFLLSRLLKQKWKESPLNSALQVLGHQCSCSSSGATYWLYLYLGSHTYFTFCYTWVILKWILTDSLLIACVQHFFASISVLYKLDCTLWSLSQRANTSVRVRHIYNIESKIKHPVSVGKKRMVLQLTLGNLNGL